MEPEHDTLWQELSWIGFRFCSHRSTIDGPTEGTFPLAVAAWTFHISSSYIILHLKVLQGGEKQVTLKDIPGKRAMWPP